MAGQALQAGQRIGGRYTLEARLGEGAYGEVWAAVTKDGGRVALKLLREGLEARRVVVERFQREAMLLEKLRHPGIARALDVGQEGQRLYFVMELVLGRTLHEVLRELSVRGATPEPAELLPPFLSLLEALAHAHARGVVHRDLKPQNVMVLPPGAVPPLKVLDFGVAKVLATSASDRTTEGRVLGSPAYMAPEQVKGAPVDVRADVFALGTILFEMLSLRRPWMRGADGLSPCPYVSELLAPDGLNEPLAVFMRIAQDPRPALSMLRPELAALDPVLKRAMAVEPEARFAHAGELAAALQAALRGEPLPWSEPTFAEASRASFTWVAPSALPEEHTAPARTALSPRTGGVSLAPLPASRRTPRWMAPLALLAAAAAGYAAFRLASAPPIELAANTLPTAPVAAPVRVEPKPPPLEVRPREVEPEAPLPSTPSPSREQAPRRARAAPLPEPAVAAAPPLAERTGGAADLSRLSATLRANPGDARAAAALAEALNRALRRLPENQTRAELERKVASSAVVGDARGLLACAQDVQALLH